MSTLSVLSGIARRLAGITIVDGRDLQLRADTLLLHSLITGSPQIVKGTSESLLRQCAAAVADQRKGAPSFEEQADCVNLNLTEQSVKLLNAIARQVRVGNSTESITDATEGALSGKLKDSFGFVPRVRPSSVPSAGLGLFVDGRAPGGSLVALYPGTCYLPSDLKELPNYPNITQDNDYLIWRYDGIVIDGKDAGDLDSTLDSEAGAYGGGTHATLQANSENVDNVYVHPLAQGHRVNHPPQGADANCLQFMFDLPLASSLRAVIPNRMFGCPEKSSRSLLERLHNTGVMQRVSSTSALTRGRWDGVSVPTLAIVATRDVVDEELFMNYRFNPSSPDLPSWYHDCDPESSQRRWKQTRILL